MMRSHRNPRRSLSAAFTLLSAVFATRVEALDYRIGVGDTIAFAVIGLPELASTAVVDADGRITLPVLGDIRVGGLTIAAAREEVQYVLPQREVNRTLADGSVSPVVVEPAQIVLSISAYRPVYVTGVVLRPGEVAYRPGLTARQSIALTGGIGGGKGKSEGVAAQVADLQAEYQTRAGAYLLANATVARLDAELAQKSDLQIKPPGGLALSPDMVERVLQTERRQLQTRAQDRAKQRAYLADAVRKQQQRVATLYEQKTQELEGLKLDSERLDRYEDLFKKGSIAMPALSEARRSVLQSSTRALQTAVAAGSIEREKDDLNRRLEQLDDERAMQILKEVQDATLVLNESQARLQAVKAKLEALRARPDTVEALEIRTSVYRQGQGAAERLSIDADAMLQPGDVIEVDVGPVRVSN